mmetsp:Transcript_81257/g.173932  ORF Transcript_81257/g.173932 Transcript_81257/m.173932 type:complete len:281 (-) Transcript_81257:535-1377(-)
MMRDCSVFAISSRTSSRPEFFDSCKRLHSPCKPQRSATSADEAPAKSDLIALFAVRFRNATKSLVSSRGNSECNRRRESRTECTQATSTRVGGHLCSISPERRSQSSSTRALTKSGNVASSMEPPATAVRPSANFWKPSTASQRWGTYNSVTRAQAACSATLSGSCNSRCSLESSAVVEASAPSWLVGSGTASESKQRSADCRITPERPLRYSLATFAGSSPRSSSVSELFTASSTERSGDLRRCSSALRIRPICKSTSSKTFKKVGMCRYCLRKPAQLQ